MYITIDLLLRSSVLVHTLKESLHIWEIMIWFWTIMCLAVHWGCPDCWWKWCFALYEGCMYNEDCHGSTYSPLCSITFLGLLPYECLIHVKCYKGFRWETYTPSGCSVMVSAPGLPLDCHYPLGIILAAIYVNPIWNVWLCNTVTWHYNVLISSHYMQRLLDNTWQCMPCLSPLGVSWTRLTRD